MHKTSTSEIANMDSLKIPKGPSSSNSNNSGGAKSTGSVPITVRFNAGEECIDDILQSFHKSNSGGGDSLSSSPLQPHQSSDDANTRNNFLQGNFFNRKRSGSIERISPTALGPNILTALSGTPDTASVGTWKLIKGKVSQTIEDIKLSKNSSQSVPSNVFQKGEAQNEPDSDQETATNNTSISEELSLDQECKAQRRGSDSDFETDIFLEADVELSRLRRGLDKLKNKVKAKSAPHQQQPPAQLLTTAIASSTARGMNRETSPSRSQSSNAAQRGKFVRKHRSESPIERAELATASSTDFEIPVAKSRPEVKKKGIVAGKRDIEIESGVEMLEDTLSMPPARTDGDNKDAESSRNIQKFPTNVGEENDAQLLQDTNNQSLTNKNSYENISDNKTLSSESGGSISTLFMSILSTPANSSERLKTTFTHIPVLTILGFAIVLVLPIHDFIRGVLACLLFILFFESVWSKIQKIIEAYLVTNPPEKDDFKIPDYSKMSICEIPAVEEHKTVKAYSGWMNEINNYDPIKYHISMTRSVYVKLEGTILRLSTTTAHIPKRVMWNEVPIDRKTLTFIDHRTYNIFGCRIEMLPRGLARKRYFNRKYPIQLIVKACTQPSSDNIPQKIEYNAPNSNTLVTKDDSDLMYFDIKDSKQSLISSHSSSSILQNTIDMTEERGLAPEVETDFTTTILNADLQALLDVVNPDEDLKTLAVPCGDEVRLLLFSRSDREKEDWYRRFVAASTGEVYDQDLRLPNLKLVHDMDLQAAAAKAAVLLTDFQFKKEISNVIGPASTVPQASTAVGSGNTEYANLENNLKSSHTTPDRENIDDGDEDAEFVVEPPLLLDETFQGLLISSCAARNPADYLRFMALYQHRRSKRQKDELWKGIDQSLFLGPSGSVVWANVLVGRILYSILNDSVMHNKIKEFLQRKLSSIRLPSFMEDVVITEINLGDTPPLIHRISQPMLDERGTWVDADVTYEGLLQITVTTKLNLLRMKRPMRQVTDPFGAGVAPPINISADEASLMSGQSLTEELLLEANSTTGSSAIFDSDAESSGGSSSESESNVVGTTGEPVNANTNEFNVFQNSPGNARRIFKIVDRFTASNFFQYATELSYVQRAMENMSANITLRVDVKGLVSRATINIPPPPSDRVWLAFRGPPRLWISAKPAVGDKSFDWSIVTNVIESKLCEEVNKYLVYPNMVDITIPFLGQATYQE